MVVEGDNFIPEPTYSCRIIAILPNGKKDVNQIKIGEAKILNRNQLSCNFDFSSYPNLGIDEFVFAMTPNSGA